MTDKTDTADVVSQNKTPIPEREPNFDTLEFLYEEDYPEQSKGDIFDKWKGLIAPDEPKISKKQFLNWSRKKSINNNQTMMRHEIKEHGIKELMKQKATNLKQIERKVNTGQDMMLDKVLEGMANAEGNQSIKERYYNLAVISKTETGIQKEKDLNIKRQKENREAVGMFASLANQAMTGELTTDDADLLEEPSETDNE
jgi:hypothetical protein